MDREQADNYEIEVVASDGAGNDVTCTVSMTVDDLNDNYPQFSQDSYTVVATDSLAAAPLITIQASDKDDGECGSAVRKIRRLPFKTTPVLIDFKRTLHTLFNCISEKH